MANEALGDFQLHAQAAARDPFDAYKRAEDNGFLSARTAAQFLDSPHDSLRASATATSRSFNTGPTPIHESNIILAANSVPPGAVAALSHVVSAESAANLSVKAALSRPSQRGGSVQQTIVESAAVTLARRRTAALPPEEQIQADDVYYPTDIDALDPLGMAAMGAVIEQQQYNARRRANQRFRKLAGSEFALEQDAQRERVKQALGNLGAFPEVGDVSDTGEDEEWEGRYPYGPPNRPSKAPEPRTTNNKPFGPPRNDPNEIMNGRKV